MTIDLILIITTVITKINLYINYVTKNILKDVSMKIKFAKLAIEKVMFKEITII